MLSDSKLGFGLMRLPKDDQGNISLKDVQRMNNAFMEKGFHYFDWENGVIQSRQNDEVARKHHKPIVVTELIKGRTLACFRPEIEKIYKDYAPNVSIASLDGIMTILSGMSNLEQMNDNLGIMTHFQKLNCEEEQ